MQKNIYESEDWEYYYNDIRHRNCEEGIKCPHCGEIIKKSKLKPKGMANRKGVGRMREYRGKRVDNGEWVYGYYGKGLVNVIDDKEIYKHFIMVWNVDLNRGYFTDYEVIPETVGQSTGLKDKNGKEIYEGDIVRHKYGRLFNIKWHDNTFCVTADIIGTSSRFENLWNLYPNDIEVIGNVFDNPDLLGGE